MILVVFDIYCNFKKTVCERKTPLNRVHMEFFFVLCVCFGEKDCNKGEGEGTDTILWEQEHRRGIEGRGRDRGMDKEAERERNRDRGGGCG